MKLPLLLFGIGSYPGTDSSEFTALQVATLPTAGRWQRISLAWSAVARRMEAGRHWRQTHDAGCSRSHIFIINIIYHGEKAMKLNAMDIRVGVFVIQGSQARLVTEVDDDGNATYCKFSADTGKPFSQPPTVCKVKTLLAWADRLASPTKAARYNPAAIIAESNLASERRVTCALAAASLGYLLAELERRGVRLTA